MADIPIKGSGPKYVAKTFSADEAVWDALVERGVNMSELLRGALRDALTELERRDRERATKPVTKVTRR